MQMTISAETEEMTATIGEIAQNAEKGRVVTAQAVENVSQAPERMDALNQVAGEITKVIDVILEIAEQTKLLVSFRFKLVYMIARTGLLL
jgi:methyl-accepting chemotaxis protein